MDTKNIFSKLFSNKQRTDFKTEEQNEGLLKDEFTMVLNRGHDDEMKLCCFRRSTSKTVLTYLFFVLTAGALRLLFHWIPHLYLLATCERCKVEQAEKVLITEVYDGKHKIYHVKDLKNLTLESVAKIQKEEISVQVTSDAPSALSVHFEKGEFRELERILLFNCKKVTYIWSVDKQEFVKLSGLDKGVSSDVLHDSIRGLSYTEQFMRLLVYGPNRITIKEQSILTLLFLEVLNPFYIFQIFSFILWFADNYYYYALTLMIMAAFGITMTVTQTRKNQRNLKSTCHSSDVCTVRRRLSDGPLDETGEKDRYETISTELLVPGDILEIPSHGCTMLCDALLLTGNCILNESMLTGESVPVTKTAFPNIPNIVYDPKEHARHTLFSGTKVIQTRYFGDEKVLAVVVRTGFSTAKGSLVRSILYPPPVDFRFEKDSYKFVAVLGLVAFTGFLYTLITKLMRGVEVGELVIEALDLITITVPPALPAAMTIGRFYAQSRLQKNQIYCISPRTINVSGSINCVCFDKTGTLTEDGLDLLCVVPIENKRFKQSVNNVESMPYDTLLYGLVSCHSLTVIDKQIVGDPLDMKMFESTKWVMEEYEVADNSKFNMIFPTVFKPPKSSASKPQDLDFDDLQIGTLREFPFSSSLQRMGVIVRRLNGTHFEYYCKGSPEMILNFVKKESVPDDFGDVLESYTQEGYRVIAIAHKVLKMSYAKVQKVQRDVIEKDLDLLGLIVLENRLKPDTTPCIQSLNDANIRVIMVTGDNILTALSVAKDCDIITPGQSVITVNCDLDGTDPPHIYYTLASMKNKAAVTSSIPNDVSMMTNSVSAVSLETVESQLQTTTANSCAPVLKADANRPAMLYNNYRFAMTGKVWAVIKEFYPELLPRICSRGSVFARMAPDQKQQLIQELQSLGYYVAMCGDGANDCGALRAAHTGISLSEAESSVASPFTSKNPNITCVPNVIREGRAALVTSFGIFKYMAAYSICQFFSVIMLYGYESNLTDIEFLYIDLAIISVIAFFFGRTESYPGKLVKETPLTSLISASPILSLFLQIMLVILFQVVAFEHLKSEPWYVPFNYTMFKEDEVACVENYTIFTISSFQYIILAVVLSKGYPYRKSIFSNYGFIISIILITSFSIYLVLDPVEPLARTFQLVLPEDFTFRLYLLVYAMVNFLASLFVEELLIEKIVFKQLRFKFHNVKKSKKKYLAVEAELNKDTKWPVLTSDFRSAASPLSPQPTCTAEIVIEKEKFDRNHVLNKLYENTNGNGTAVSQSPQKVQNEHFSNEDLLFSSLPSEQVTSPSDTFKSLSNNFDLASSNVNIPELPYDAGSPVKVVSDVERNDDVSHFNSFGTSPVRQLDVVIPLEMNNLDTNR
ncbi:unnamed protein product [Acanthoscelides obtectus]|uniref:Cation-transporting ATPase n=1 Tax=Acanthoscelides obtectus TaxID=200917 RepID=A0A9P0M974_ACAOB|nr:unnamed protein product [Acanthoscelides obtectus]CAK1637673.1 Probable cation-transporting ATPase 13A3 [Acanthoscelides obtectus]